MTNGELFEAVGGIGWEYVQMAHGERRRRMSVVALAAALVLAVGIAAAVPALRGGPETGGETPGEYGDGGGAVFPGAATGEGLTPTLLAAPETVEELKGDLTEGKLDGWTDEPGAELDFEHVFPLYCTAGTAESGEVADILAFDGQYILPALRDGEYIGMFEAVYFRGKWTLSSYTGADIDGVFRKCGGSATCLVYVSELREFGFLSRTENGETYYPFPNLGRPDEMSGAELMEEILRVRESRSPDGQSDG